MKLKIKIKHFKCSKNNVYSFFKTEKNGIIIILERMYNSGIHEKFFVLIKLDILTSIWYIYIS